MYKIGLSSCSNINEDFFKNCAEAGISLMELAVSADKYDGLPYREILNWSKKYGVDIWSFHLPFTPFECLDISHKALCKKTVDYLSELIKKAADIGADKFIIHASGEPVLDDERQGRMEIAKKSLYVLAEVAKTYGGVVVVENLPRTCLGKNSAEIKELISAHSSLRVCFDTNHLLCEDAVDFIRNIGDKIVTTHISDFDFYNERHWLPGEGKLDWQAILRALKEIGYQGPWLYEIGFACPKTIYRDRDLTCDDFVRNAKELFNNTSITTFSRHKEKLGMWE